MNRYIPLTIFIISFIGSMILTTMTYQGNSVVEANPIIRFMFSRSLTLTWIYGIGIVTFILLAGHFGFKRRKYTRTYHVVYWLLAMIFLVNFVRELILVF